MDRESGVQAFGKSAANAGEAAASAPTTTIAATITAETPDRALNIRQYCTKTGRSELPARDHIRRA
jgi:hypothetical protein